MDRDEFLARMTSEVSKQDAKVTKRADDEATAQREVKSVINRLLSIVHRYNDWIKLNGFIVDSISTDMATEVKIGETREKVFSLNFGLGPNGSYMLYLQKPFDMTSGEISIEEPAYIPASDWNDGIFEQKIQQMIADLVKRRAERLA